MIFPELSNFGFVAFFKFFDCGFIFRFLGLNSFASFRLGRTFKAFPERLCFVDTFFSKFSDSVDMLFSERIHGHRRLGLGRAHGRSRR